MKLLILLWTVALSASDWNSKAVTVKSFQNIRKALGSHYCSSKDIEHSHDQETLRRIESGAVVLTPRVCHQETRRTRIVYKYYVSATKLTEATFHDGQRAHVHVAWEREDR